MGLGFLGIQCSLLPGEVGQGVPSFSPPPGPQALHPWKGLVCGWLVTWWRQYEGTASLGMESLSWGQVTALSPWGWAWVTRATAVPAPPLSIESQRPWGVENAGQLLRKTWVPSSNWNFLNPNPGHFQNPSGPETPNCLCKGISTPAGTGPTAFRAQSLQLGSEANASAPALGHHSTHTHTHRE